MTEDALAAVAAVPPPALDSRGTAGGKLFRVRTLDGLERTVDLPLEARAAQLKSRLQEDLGIPVAGIKLLAGLQELDPRALLQPGEPLTLVRISQLPTFLERKGLGSVNATARDGSTALHLAAAQGEAALCFELLADRAFEGLNDLDFLGNSVLHRAVEGRLPEVCAAILARADFAQLAAANHNGHTALHLAALRDDLQTARAMLAHRSPPQAVTEAAGALPDDAALANAAMAGAVDALGETAADIAESGACDELAELLRLATSAAAR